MAEIEVRGRRTGQRRLAELVADEGEATRVELQVRSQDRTQPRPRRHEAPLQLRRDEAPALLSLFVGEQLLGIRLGILPAVQAPRPEHDGSSLRRRFPLRWVAWRGTRPIARRQNISGVMTFCGRG